MRTSSTVRGHKPSQVAWMQGVDVPSEWHRTKVKHLITEARAGNAITSEQIEPLGEHLVYGGNGRRGYTDGFTHTGTYLLIGRQGALCGNVHLVSGTFWASEHAIVCEPRPDVVPRWLAYLLEVMDLGQYSVTAAQPGIGVSQVVNVETYVPPPAEQRAIADFLDERTSRIDTLIAKQDQLITTLRERRAAITLQTVTKGRRAKASHRPSGLRWAGDVPAAWDVANIRRYATMKTGHTPSRFNSEFWNNCTIPWFTLADVWQLRDGRATYLTEETATRINEAGLENSSAELLPAGTVVLSRTASVGFSGIMPVPMATSQDYWNWVCGPKLLPTFLLATFRAMSNELGSLVMGSTHKTIYQPVAASMSIVIPPLDEQQEIVDFLNEQTSRIDALIAKTDEHMALAKERRAALITAAVTGQIDVRTAPHAANGVM